MSNRRAVSSNFHHAAIFCFKAQDVLMETKTHSGHPKPSVANRDARSARKGIFRKEGEYWTIGYGANFFRLKDSKGLAYLA